MSGVWSFISDVTQPLGIFIFFVMDKNLLALYSDYLLSSFGATTAAGLSSLLDGQISHDQVTRFLSQAEYTSKELWHQVKSSVRTIEREDGVLIFDDTIQEKPHTDENELICWHFDHSKNRSQRLESAQLHLSGR